jgi:hypothetical protein
MIVLLSVGVAHRSAIREVMSIEKNDDPNFFTVAKSAFLYFASKTFASKAFVQMKMNVRCRTQQSANDSFLRCESS